MRFHRPRPYPSRRRADCNFYRRRKPPPLRRTQAEARRSAVGRVEQALPPANSPPNNCALMRRMATAENADLSRITVTPGQRSGQPCIRDLRVTVWDVLDMLASGMTEGEILNDYPYLEKADFPAVYAYASQAGRERASH